MARRGAWLALFALLSAPMLVMAQYRDSGSYSPNQYPNTQYPNSPNPNAQSYIPEGTRFIAVLDDKLETNKA
ncbi:MAG: hypothetical protein JO187_04180, partial [Acidobacteria bacterium]|nr:hypothetical protein [Acidobacteriota bacterium]